MLSLSPPGPETDLGAAAGRVHHWLLPVPGHSAASPSHFEFLQVGRPALHGGGRDVSLRLPSKMGTVATLPAPPMDLGEGLVGG